MGDETMRELADLRDRLEGGSMYHASNSNVTVELLDQGMIVSYKEPAKRTRMVGGIHIDPTTSLLVQLLPQIMENLPGSEGEEWDERKENRKNLIKIGMEKAMEAMKPKAVEEWCWETKRVVCPDSQALVAILDKAKEAMGRAKALEETGVHIHHAGYSYAAAAHAGNIGSYPVPPVAFPSHGIGPAFDLDTDQEPL